LKAHNFMHEVMYSGGNPIQRIESKLLINLIFFKKRGIQYKELKVSLEPMSPLNTTKRNPIQRIESIKRSIINVEQKQWIQYKELKVSIKHRIGLLKITQSESNTKNWKDFLLLWANRWSSWHRNPIQRIESYKPSLTYGFNCLP